MTTDFEMKRVAVAAHHRMVFDIHLLNQFLCSIKHFIYIALREKVGNDMVPDVSSWLMSMVVDL